MAPRPAYGFFIRQNERTAIGNQETEPCPRTPCGSTGTCPGSDSTGSSRRRSPRHSTRCSTRRPVSLSGRLDTSVPAAGRRIARTATSTCPGLAARRRERTDYRATGGHGQKCTISRSTLLSAAFRHSVNPRHPVDDLFSCLHSD